MSIDNLGELWDQLFGAQPDPPAVIIAGTALLALLVVAVRAAWRVARNAITIAHEGGHALIAVLTGRTLTGVRLHSDTSGLTLSRGRPSGPGMAFTLFAGYTAPSLLGLLGAWLLAEGRIILLLWSAVVLLLAMLVMIRNGYGIVSVVATVAVVFGVSWFASAQVQAIFAYIGVWFLLIGGVRPIGELQRLRWRGRLPDSDADQLARVTHLPAIFWVALFGLVTVIALAAGGYLLLDPLLTDHLPPLDLNG